MWLGIQYEAALISSLWLDTFPHQAIEGREFRICAAYQRFCPRGSAHFGLGASCSFPVILAIFPEAERPDALQLPDPFMHTSGTAFSGRIENNADKKPNLRLGFHWFYPMLGRALGHLMLDICA
jgi:hypothetical protein